MLASTELTDEELVAKAQAGDSQAEADLVIRYERLVHKLAFLHGRKDDDDILQEGRCAIMRSARRWEPNRGLKFITYAFHAVRYAILDACRNTTVIRYPKNVNERHITFSIHNDNPDNPRGDWLARYEPPRELADLLEVLTEEEKLVIELRCRGYRFDEVGERISKSKARAVQLNEAAIDKMRRFARRCG